MVNHTASIFTRQVYEDLHDVFLVFEGGVVMVAHEVEVGELIQEERFRKSVDSMQFTRSNRTPEWVADNVEFWGATITSVQPRI